MPVGGLYPTAVTQLQEVLPVVQPGLRPSGALRVLLVEQRTRHPLKPLVAFVHPLAPKPVKGRRARGHDVQAQDETRANALRALCGKIRLTEVQLYTDR